jgi:phosphoglycerate dehydrogenase-like enzyme
MTPHIAGCVGQMRSRLGATAVEELRRFFAGEPQLCPITPDMLPRIG